MFHVCEKNGCFFLFFLYNASQYIIISAHSVTKGIPHLLMLYVHTNLETVNESNKPAQKARAEKDKQGVPSVVVWFLWKYVYLWQNWPFLTLVGKGKNNILE